MKSCNEMKELRNKKYEELLFYIERKIFNALEDGYIFIDEDETLDKNVKFNDSRWITLLENSGYKVEYYDSFVTPTMKISGW